MIFRMGLGISRNHSRQIVRNNFVYVNDRRVNIPSFLVKTGDFIQVKPKEKNKQAFKDNLAMTKDRTVPSWLEFNSADFKAKVNRLPEKNDIQQPIEEQLIVEFYSK